MTDPKTKPPRDDEGNDDDVRASSCESDTADAPAPEPDAAPSPLEAVTARVAELEDKLLRREAEFLNETKRIRKNADQQGRFAIERVVQDLLPVIDALHSAIGNTSEDDVAHREGLGLIERTLADVLGRHGIERIDATGQAFDPGIHEAMLVVEDSERPPQTVTEELRAGFRLHDRVVRPAQVIVTKHPAPAEDHGADEEDGDADV